MYSIVLTLIKSGTEYSVTLYAEIQPPKFLHMLAESIVRDVNTESVYKINFTLPTFHVYPNSYHDTANRSRILVEFPTTVGNLDAFNPTLGGYSGSYLERVGCYFKTGGSFITFEPGYQLQCRLIPSRSINDPTKV
jgi:hypothetical protein